MDTPQPTYVTNVRANASVAGISWVNKHIDITNSIPRVIPIKLLYETTNSIPIQKYLTFHMIVTGSGEARYYNHFAKLETFKQITAIT